MRLIHTVYFWLTDEARENGPAFEAALKELLTIEQIADGQFGPPAATEHRPVTDHSFDVALVLQFDSQADHDTYQAHPDHDAFVERWKSGWSRVQVYDIAADAS